MAKYRICKLHNCFDNQIKTTGTNTLYKKLGFIRLSKRFPSHQGSCILTGKWSVFSVRRSVSKNVIVRPSVFAWSQLKARLCPLSFQIYKNKLKRINSADCWVGCVPVPPSHRIYTNIIKKTKGSDCWIAARFAAWLAKNYTIRS